jgi:hypothetical protein
VQKQYSSVRENDGCTVVLTAQCWCHKDGVAEMKTCGHDDHSEYCLCDVGLIGVRIDATSVQGMWMGDRVAEIRDYDLTSRRDIVEWLADVTALHDALRGNYVPKIEDVPPVQFNENSLVYWKAIRDGVTAMIRNYPVNSVLDALPKLEVSLTDFMVAMTTNKIERILTPDEYRAFEVDMLRRNPNYAAVGRLHGLGRNTVRSFRALLEPVVIRIHGSGNNMRIVRKEFHDLIMSGRPADEIIKEIKEKHGVTYSRSSVYNYRNQHQGKE